MKLAKHNGIHTGYIDVEDKGHIEITESPEADEFPGVDIEFVPNTPTDKVNPRVVFECHGDIDEPRERWHVHIWADPDSEDDPTHTIYFD